MKYRHYYNYIIAAVIIVLMASITSIVVSIQNDKYQDRANAKLSSLTKLIIEKYPKVDVNDIAKTINEDSGLYSDTKLDNYCIDFSKSDSIKGMEKIGKSTIAIILGVYIALTIITFAIIYVINRYRKQKINEIISYIERIYNRDYELNIKDNSEEDLSRLKNELYKIVILLKEQAVLSNENHANLSKSVADISHQIKTPLTSISIMLDNIIDNPDMDINVRTCFVNEISRQIDWINWLVISMLKLARFDANVVEFDNSDVDIYKLLNEAKKNLEIMIEVKEVEFVIEDNKNIIYTGDYKWNLEAFTNIIKNCIEHSEAGQKIYASFEQNNLYTKIVIKDEGCGMSKEDAKHVFERFYRGRKASENSIGIGLALAKSVFEQQGGYIVCDSNEGVGTSFIIKISKITI